MTLSEALQKYAANFSWDENNKTWCLHGTTEEGLGWETDNYEAVSREEAESDAVDYLVEYNS